MDAELSGHCHARYAFVRDLLANEFLQERALGQAVAIVVDGEPVVHLWSGHADAGRTRPWRDDTISCLFSASKPLAAACVLKLVERGAIELETRITEFWPEFAAHGKQECTVRHALAHLAGVPIAEAAPARSVYDPDRLASALAEQQPLGRRDRNSAFTRSRTACSRPSSCAASMAARCRSSFAPRSPDRSVWISPSASSRTSGSAAPMSSSCPVTLCSG